MLKMLIKQAFNEYLDRELAILKKENPSLKRSQLIDMIHRNVQN